MTAPIPILPGRSYLLRRRIAFDRKLLTTDPITQNLIAYSLAESASRFGIVLHAFTFVLDHYALVCSDPFGLLPRFTEHLHARLAKLLNTRWSSQGYIWSDGPPECARLARPLDLLAAIVDVVTLPVSLGLVDTPCAWSGLRSHGPERELAPRTVERPATYRAAGPMPASARLEVEPPASVDAHEIAKAVQRRVAHLLSLRKKPGTETRPSPEPPRTPRLRFVWARDEAWLLALARELRAFRAAYRLALARIETHLSAVLFPRGTFKLAALGLPSDDELDDAWDG